MEKIYKITIDDSDYDYGYRSKTDDYDLMKNLNRNITMWINTYENKFYKYLGNQYRFINKDDPENIKKIDLDNFKKDMELVKQNSYNRLENDDPEAAEYLTSKEYTDRHNGENNGEFKFSKNKHSNGEYSQYEKEHVNSNQVNKNEYKTEELKKLEKDISDLKEKLTKAQNDYKIKENRFTYEGKTLNKSIERIEAKIKKSNDEKTELNLLLSAPNSKSKFNKNKLPDDEIKNKITYLDKRIAELEKYKDEITKRFNSVMGNEKVKDKNLTYNEVEISEDNEERLKEIAELKLQIASKEKELETMKLNRKVSRPNVKRLPTKFNKSILEIYKALKDIGKNNYDYKRLSKLETVIYNTPIKALQDYEFCNKLNNACRIKLITDRSHYDYGGSL